MANNQQGAGDADFTLKCQIIDEASRDRSCIIKGIQCTLFAMPKMMNLPLLAWPWGFQVSTNWKGIDLVLKILQFT